MNKTSTLASILLAAVAIDGATVARPPAWARRLRTRNVYSSSSNRGLASVESSSSSAFGEEREPLRALEGTSMSMSMSVSMSMSMSMSMMEPSATMTTEDTATSEDVSASGDDAPSAPEVAPRSGAASMGMIAASSAIVTAAAGAAMLL